MRMWELVVPILIVVSLSGAGVAAAQPTPSRLEIGAQASLLHLSDFETTSAGVGGRLSFDVARFAAVEAEANFFPNDDVLLAPSTVTPDLRVTYHRRRTDAFVGMKLGARREKVGVFAKVRPGLTHLTDDGGPQCAGSLCPLVLLVRPEYRTEFALDWGGVLEFYPSTRLVARFELGDTMIRHRSFAPPCWLEGCTSHNLSSRLGVGFRF
jgi:hypothetical protein